jgi:large conductance mechanosensitive channel
MKLIEEFKSFAFKGNVLDMAVGVIVGTAFSKIVSSLVGDLVMPLFGAIGGVKFTDLMWKIGESEIKYGQFVQNVVDFFIIAICVFAFVKMANFLKNLKKAAPQEVEEPAPAKKSDELVVLEEIAEKLGKLADK